MISNKELMRMRELMTTDEDLGKDGVEEVIWWAMPNIVEMIDEILASREASRASGPVAAKEE